ncbi:hypothetical protein [Comamonas sp. 4034]|uniref:hypothetical protein n=1 Tax=Comamonas sp. 4034 TaxID=3156455 RepID=UPI003D1A347C
MTTNDPIRGAFETAYPSAVTDWHEGNQNYVRYANEFERWKAAAAREKAGRWQPIETAPKDGSHFLALIGGLPYEARFDEHGRFIRFIHTNVAPGAVWKIHQHDGREMREQHLPPEEPRYIATGMIWQNGFDVEPTCWSPLPAALKQEGAKS